MNLPVSLSERPVAVIGAGPVGLAAAAHLLQRGLPVLVFESGPGVAHHLEQVRHVRLFSGWRWNVDRAARALLAQAGHAVPDDDSLPTAGDLIDRYLKPLSQLPQLAPHLRLGTRVLAVSRARLDKSRTAGRERAPFLLRVQGPGDGEQEVQVRAVIDATGTWGQPNPLGAHGLPALGEREAAGRLAYGMPDILGRERARYAGRRVLVVGAGHSAAGNLLALVALAQAEPTTRIVWAVRGTDLRRLFGGGANDGLPARGELGRQLQALTDSGRLELHLGFGIGRIEVGVDGTLRVHALDAPQSPRPPIEGIEQIVSATGSRPDLTLGRELRLRWDAWLESTDALAPLIDPNEHSCGTVRPHGHRELAHALEPGYYAVGSRSYGRAPNFLLATGYEQVRSVVAALAGDLAAADDVQLELPQTGVCSVDLLGTGGTGGTRGTGSVAGAASGAPAAACCGGPPQVLASACCVRDEAMKAAGRGGCGCGTPSRASASSVPA